MAGVLTLLVLIALPAHGDSDRVAAGPPAEEKPPNIPVKLPGLVADTENRRIDLDAKICLDKGLLELVACTEDTKEHESIVVVKASPKIIHAALLLIGANNGGPGRVEPVDEEQTQWRQIPPRGDALAVSLLITNADGDRVERPIQDFIRRAEPVEGAALDANDDTQETKGDAAEDQSIFSRFLFAGSVVMQDDQGNKRYSAEESGHVVSISTFGDEVVCLPDHMSKDNNALVWEVDPRHLPAVGTKVVLRLTLEKKPKQEQAE